MGIHIINPLLGIVPSTLNPLYISCCYFCPEAQVDNLILKLLLALARSLARSLSVSVGIRRRPPRNIAIPQLQRVY